MHQSPAVLCTEMIPARHEVAEAKTATTASVYETLFGCPPQFATVADVIPESQAISQGHVHTPREEQNMQASPSSLLAFSAITTKSEVPMSKELEQDMQVSVCTHLFTKTSDGPEHVDPAYYMPIIYFRCWLLPCVHTSIRQENFKRWDLSECCYRVYVLYRTSRPLEALQHSADQPRLVKHRKLVRLPAAST